MPRPIDADEVVAWLKFAKNCVYGSGSMNDIERIIEKIRKWPTMRTVKGKTEHAKWIGLEYDGYADGNPVYNLWECSACGLEHKGEETPNYCSNCGRIMDREELDDA